MCCVVIIARGTYTHTFTRTQGQASVRGKLRGHARVNYTCFSFFFFVFVYKFNSRNLFLTFIYHTNFKTDYFGLSSREGGCVFVGLPVIIVIIVFFF